MSMIVNHVNADNIVELDADRYYYVVTVAWEYDEARYVMASDRPDAIKIDFTPMVQAMPRDEGFVITDVRPL